MAYGMEEKPVVTAGFRQLRVQDFSNTAVAITHTGEVWREAPPGFRKRSYPNGRPR